MSQYDIQSVYEFLKATPEGGLRKMLVDGKTMTDVHFNLLAKIFKSCSGEQFVQHFEKQDFPKIRMSPAEDKLREKFWGACEQMWLSRGLMQPANQQKAA